LRPVERPRDAEIVALRADGCSLAEIGRRFGVSRQRVDQILRRAGVAQAGTARSRALRTVQAAAVREQHAKLAAERSVEILERYRHGEDPAAIARELQLQCEVVTRLIAGSATDADRAARCKTLQRPATPKYSDEELVRGVALVASKLGHTPTCAEYDRVARELGLACVATVYQRSGTWRRAVHAAGLEPRRPPVTPPRWDAAACWQALHSVADQLGDPPRYHRYVQLAGHRHDLPPAPTVRQRLGFWHEVARQLTTHRDGRTVQATADHLKVVGPIASSSTNSHGPAEIVSRRAHDGRDRLPSVLSVRALRFLAEHPGSSGRAVGRALGIRHDSQTWALLHRFERDGLLAKEPNGIASAWTVTERGHQLLRDLPAGVYE